MSFLLFIYQQNIGDHDNNRLNCYDINEEKIVKSISINPKVVKQLFVDDTGFNIFKMTRTSDKLLYRNKEDPEAGHATCFDYSIFSFFDPKSGRIQVQDFHVRHKWSIPTLEDDPGSY